MGFSSNGFDMFPLCCLKRQQTTAKKSETIEHKEFATLNTSQRFPRRKRFSRMDSMSCVLLNRPKVVGDVLMSAKECVNNRSKLEESAASAKHLLLSFYTLFHVNNPNLLSGDDVLKRFFLPDEILFLSSVIDDVLAAIDCYYSSVYTYSISVGRRELLEILKLRSGLELFFANFFHLECKHQSIKDLFCRWADRSNFHERFLKQLSGLKEASQRAFFDSSSMSSFPKHPWWSMFTKSIE
jgi:hypothetical protein